MVSSSLFILASPLSKSLQCLISALKQGGKDGQLVRLDHLVRTSLVAQTVKRLSTVWETRVQALGWEDPLEKEMAIYSSTIAWKIPWTEEPGRLQSMRWQRVRHN